MKGKIVFITGAGSGIGRQTALDFAELGAIPIVVDIDEAKIKAVVDEIKNKGGDAYPLKLDITDTEAVKKAVDEIAEKYQKIDILVNNAGVQSNPGDFIRTKKKNWDHEINVNIYGVLNCTQAIAKIMKRQNYGRIVSIGSDAGKVGEPLIVVYSGTKGFIIAFTKALAKELGKSNITVNMVCPGTTRTPLTEPLFQGAPQIIEKMVKRYPMRRLGEPKDISNAVLFLAKEESGWITGQILSVSGGYSMC
ncbi:MAG TPA: SDR family NAD(P)-dependent oxidoreductase [Candidatus Deferrimicrobium sp.]|nr:SDR family NAD(P)-dependent oxidoreductase [Candidatus Deferrimicrobium sp.]